jgi:hypothetical protein
VTGPVERSPKDDESVYQAEHKHTITGGGAMGGM